MRWAGYVARRGEMRGTHRILVEKSKGNRPFGRPRHRWEDHIKIDLKTSGIAGYVLTGLIWLWIGTGGGLL
jgi:hypothetical protein